MKHIINAFFGALVTTGLFAQSKSKIHPIIDSIYQQWQHKRIDSLRGTPWDTFYYAPQIPPEILDGLKEKLLELPTITQLVRINPFLFKDTTHSERIRITQAEVDSILQSIELSGQFEWPEGLFYKGQRMPLEIMDTMEHAVNKKQGVILRLFPYQLHLFSYPIVFRNNTLCLFFSGKTDVLGGLGEFWLYRREKDVWTQFGRVTVWMDMDLSPPEY